MLHERQTAHTGDDNPEPIGTFGTFGKFGKFGKFGSIRLIDEITFRL